MKSKKAGKFRHSQNVKRRTKPGSAPGLLNIDPQANSTIIRVMAFQGSNFLEKEIQNVEDLRAICSAYRTVWVDVTGLGSEAKLQSLGHLLNLHPLALEDVVNVHQRAKVDEFGESLFIVARMVDGLDALETEQLSFFLLKQVLVSFQERAGDCWEPIRQRIRTHRGRICDSGADYLLYALLDAVIDSYFPVIERVADEVDALEDAIIDNPSRELMGKIHQMRGQLLALRRAIRPHREMINELIRDSLPSVQGDTRVHLRDCYDHIVQVLDAVDTYRELTSDMRDFYLSSVSNNMNEVMKVLTIISTIFIPLSFVAGVYGMNFDFMPELKWRYGYPLALVLMTSVALGFVYYFRLRRWI